MPGSVLLTDVRKSFARPGGGRRGDHGARPVLADINLEVRSGETLTIIGPSGSGKSTLLNCIGGLEGYEGSIAVDGKAVTEPLPKVATVFQAPHLLPWRTTLGNVVYGLELQRQVPRSEWRGRAEHFLNLVGLAEAADHYPSQLSGGMQQRVNIARALAVEPDLLLMDEPFGALDAISKEYLQEELQGIVARQKLTTIFVTHDISEAIFLGDRVVVLGANPGRVAVVREIPEARPRKLAWKRTAQFQSYYSDLWDALMRA